MVRLYARESPSTSPSQGIPNPRASNAVGRHAEAQLPRKTPYQTVRKRRRRLWRNLQLRLARLGSSTDGSACRMLLPDPSGSGKMLFGSSVAASFSSVLSMTRTSRSTLGSVAVHRSSPIQTSVGFVGPLVDTLTQAIGGEWTVVLGWLETINCGSKLATLCSRSSSPVLSTSTLGRSSPMDAAITSR